MTETIAEVGEIAPGTVVAVDDEVCLVRTDAGVFAVQRTCPHAGADLAQGYVEAGRLRCTWHNLPYDPGTGAQPCLSLPNLRTYEVEQVAPGRYAIRRGSQE